MTTCGVDDENTKLCHDGYYAEPHVAETALVAMLGKEAKNKVWKGCRLKSARAANGKLTGLTILNRQPGKEHPLKDCFACWCLLPISS